MKAFILAGGFATRLWPLTEKRAKPLLPLAGKPILTHLVEQIPADVPVTVSTNAAFADGFAEWKNTLARPVDVVVERTKHDDEKLGALGATAQWIEEQKIDDDLLLLTGDNYCGFSMQKFLDAYDGKTALLAAFDIGEKELAKQFGTVIANETGTVTGFEEKPKEPQSTLVATGCAIIPKDYLSTLVAFAKSHPDNVGGIFEEFLRQSIGVRCFTFDEAWFDIGSFQAYLDATKELVGDAVVEGSNVQLHASSCQGSVVLGDRSSVEGSTLQDTVLFEDCIVRDCTLIDCVLDRGCRVEGIDLQGKMLREGSVLTQK